VNDELHRRLVEVADEYAPHHHPHCAAPNPGPCLCPNGTLVAVIRAVIAVHHPRESRSINTLDCPAHDVRRGPASWRDDPDYDGCPDCVVTPITVCASDGCERYPCETVTVVAEALGVAR
jgi:hypothetical protein